ncbi:hypothetical protein EJ08DRAFT_703906 [Tothia fuscella]|uniref:Uncharacterized protein n=1 Tax=Tothia fuscella TaxID=1048955 RepID=A0A9P4NDJ4_9PEZI|nr:hypothetical protein EJ08DRAFT_703906 [Tothia fuscella]
MLTNTQQLPYKNSNLLTLRCGQTRAKQTYVLPTRSLLHDREGLAEVTTEVYNNTAKGELAPRIIYITEILKRT